MKAPQDIIDLVNSYSNFLAHIHLGPDADSVGSALALKIGLESVGKVVRLYCEDSIPEELRFLPQTESIEKIKMSLSLTYPYDVYLALDTANWSLASTNSRKANIRKPVVNIDHHPDNQIKSKYTWIEAEGSSTAEMVYFLLKALDIDITVNIATCLTAGIICDTDTFQNSNSSADALNLVAKFQTLGVNYHYCVTQIARSLRFEEVKTWSILLENLKYSDDKSFVWSTLPYDQWRNSPCDIRLGVFANAIISRIKDTDFGAVLIEKEPGTTKGSIRARKPKLDVSQIAHLLHGGGHLASASFCLNQSLVQAEAEFLRTVNHLKSLSKL